MVVALNRRPSRLEGPTAHGSSRRDELLPRPPLTALAPNEFDHARRATSATPGNRERAFARTGRRHGDPAIVGVATTVTLRTGESRGHDSRSPGSRRPPPGERRRRRAARRRDGAAWSLTRLTLSPTPWTRRRISMRRRSISGTWLACSSARPSLRRSATRGVERSSADRSRSSSTASPARPGRATAHLPIPSRDLGLTGAHVGCSTGLASTCTVLVNESAANSSLMSAVQADGHRSPPSKARPVRRA